MPKVTRHYPRCHLVRAKNDKNDEYYTLLTVIEQEVPRYSFRKKNVFYLANGVIRFGYSIPNELLDPEGNTVKLTGLCRWFTNLDSNSPKTIRMFTANYHPDLYQQFDYYPAINVDRSKDIPCDYDGLMGVPITALEHLDTNNYEIVDLIARYAVIDHSHDVKGHQLTEVNGNPKFSRLIIKTRIINIKTQAA